MQRRSDAHVAICVVDRAKATYLFFRSFIPVLEFWGFNILEIDIGEAASNRNAIETASVIIFGQENVAAYESAHLVAALNQAVAAGAGVVNFDHTHAVAPLRGGGVKIKRRSGRIVASESMTVCDPSHFIGQMQRRYLEFRPKRPIATLVSEPGAGVLPMLEDENRNPLLDIVAGPTRVANWRCSSWIWAPEFLGFGHGLDAFFWRTILWAAKKPFAIRAFPPLGRLRIDDCRGLANAAEHFEFLDVLAEFGEIPNFGLCIETMQSSGWSALAERARRGKVDVSPHLFSPERGIYDHQPSAEVVIAVGRQVAEAFAAHGCPMAKSISDHNHVLTETGVQIARHLGMRYRMNVMRLGEQWEDPHRRWRPKPFGLMNFALDWHPDAPELFTAINHHYSLNDTFIAIDSTNFLCTEYGGYTVDRWDFLNGLVSSSHKDLAGVKARIEKHAEVCLTSLFFCGSITHTHFCSHLSGDEWRDILSGYRSYTDQFGYRPTSYDAIAQYASQHCGPREPTGGGDGPDAYNDQIWWLDASDHPKTPLAWRQGSIQ